MSGAIIKIDMPKRFTFECPVCGAEQECRTDYVDWTTGDPRDGGWVSCDECLEEINLNGEMEICIRL